MYVFNTVIKLKHKITIFILLEIEIILFQACGGDNIYIYIYIGFEY
jgi:hypothetical protein